MTQLSDWEKIHYGLVLGRFQPLHLGHLEYLGAARDKSGHLVIGITNPNTARLIHDSADPQRSRTESNPFSFFDRQEMITASLVEMGWAYAEFSIVPASINSPEEMWSYLPAPERTTVYVTDYDGWATGRLSLSAASGIRWKCSGVAGKMTASRRGRRSGKP